LGRTINQTDTYEKEITVTAPTEDTQSRFLKQIEFIREIDRLKKIVRRNWLCDGSRRENDAEHSWHIAAMAMVLAEHAAEPIDLLRVIKMLLIHDVIEIDAGDTYAYDPAANEDKEARELVAADRIFGMLPDDQAVEFRALWDEFEEESTAEARFALALDRILPLMMNIDSGGMAWIENGVTAKQVRDRMAPIVDGCPALAELAECLIQRGVDEGRICAE